MPTARKHRVLDLVIDGIPGHLSPATKTLRWLESRGFRASMVEWRTGPVTHDAHGWADIHFFDPRMGPPMLDTDGMVQVTSLSHFNDRLAKVLANRNAKAYAKGRIVEVHAWGPSGRLIYLRVFSRRPFAVPVGVGGTWSPQPSGC